MTGKISNTRLKNKQKILSTAKKLFLENGIHQTTMQDIAKHSGFGRNTLYTYYESKELLADDIYEDVFVNIFLNDINKIKRLDTIETGYEKLYFFLHNHITSLYENEDELIYTYIYEYFYRNQRGTVNLEKHGRKVAKIVTRYIDDGIEDGSINCMGMSCDYLFGLMLGSIYAFMSRICYRGVSVDKGYTKPDIFYNYLKILMKGIKNH